MRFLELLLLISLCFISCKKKGSFTENDVVSETTTELGKQTEESLQLDLGDLFLLVDADKEDFDISKIVNDTITIEKVLYKDLDGAILKPKRGIKILNIEELIFIDAFQYTIDDNPATPLKINLKKEIQKNSLTEYRLKNIEEFNKWVFDGYFNEIKNKSVNFQNIFFTNLQKDKAKYLDCCKEYLVQADNFLNSNKDDYQDLKALKVELFIKKRVLRIGYINGSHTQMKTIIYKS